MKQKQNLNQFLIEEQCLKLEDLFKKIKSLDYFITKLETPYSAVNFPFSYPVGRDVDIICEDKSYDKIIKNVYDFFENQQGFNKKIRADNPNNLRFRFETEDYFKRKIFFSYDKLINGQPITKLHYQIDVSKISENNLDTIYDNFGKDCLKNREMRNGVFSTSKSDEILIRILSHKKTLRKDHHYDYIITNKKYFDISRPYKINFINFVKSLKII